MPMVGERCKILFLPTMIVPFIYPRGERTSRHGNNRRVALVLDRVACSTCCTGVLGSADLPPI
jgi:hypothetical protein